MAFLWTLAITAWQVLQHQYQYDPVTLHRVAACDAAFLVIDFGSAALAFAMERRENWRLMPWPLLQRFGYRQLMYWVGLKALVTAAVGPLVGWGKLKRKSTVTTPA
jgi:peptidoglycan-N-acetylglucosamine deacetylase